MSEEVVGEGIDLAEIEKKYETKGYFARLGDMFRGLKMPHDSGEYKLARIELQRQTAPICAFVFVVLFVSIAAVLTMANGNNKEVVEVTIAEIDEDTPMEEQQEEEPPDDIEPPPLEEVEVMVDTPNPGPVSNITPMPSPPSTQVSVKPAPQDTVAFVDSPVKMKSMTGSRTPGSIGAATRGGAGYGDATTEACVMKVLWWLKANQSTDGSWKGGQNPLANTALAVLTYLAHGEYPGSPSPFQKDFGPVVQQAVDWLCNQVSTDPSGKCVMRGVDGNEYAFLIATYALCEAYGMTRNPNAKIAAEKGMQRIINNQSPTGGWDYRMVKTSTRDDMSYEGWALQALKAGKMAGLHPEGLEECIKKAIKCLKTRNFRNGGFNYTAGGGPTGLTATGCLYMQLLGYTTESEVKAALDTMRGWLPVFESKARLEAGGPTPGSNPQYYCYYAAQCKYQVGMCPGAKPENLKSWQDWNVAMKKLYPTCMIDDGTIEGPDGKPKPVAHWVFADATCGGKNNTTMATCLCALQLMVYYRYLPTTQIDKSAAASAEKSAAETKKDERKKAKEVEVEVDI